jgi:hypothetical protein
MTPMRFSISRRAKSKFPLCQKMERKLLLPSWDRIEFVGEGCLGINCWVLSKPDSRKRSNRSCCYGLLLASNSIQIAMKSCFATHNYDRSVKR